MASAGLAQIDENSSLTQSGDSSPLVLPNLLRRPSGIPSSPFGFAGEKTPEFWPKKHSLGEATPEAWPKTPTPRCCIRANFNLGDQTPESWPEAHSSFFLCPQQPAMNAQPAFMPMLMPVGTGQSINAPMWMSQVPCPVGMVYNSDIANASNVGLAAASPFTTAQSIATASGSTNKVRCSNPPVVQQAEPSIAAGEKSLADGKATKSMKSTKATKPGKPNPEEEDACPVAVYVDLSSLKDMRPALGRFGTAKL